MGSRVIAWAVALAALEVAACARQPPVVPQHAAPDAAAVKASPRGCDESKPECWVGGLRTDSTRGRAVDRLAKLFDDAQDRTAFVDKVVEPLTTLYVQHYAELDTSTRVELIRLLATFRDKRTLPALAKAFDEYAERPPSSSDESDIVWAAEAATDLRLPALGDPLLRAFVAFRCSTRLGGIAFRKMSAAMLAAPQPGWVQPLIRLLEPEVDVPTDPDDADKIDRYRDQLFWQTVAAQVLGEVRASEAVGPLLKLMLDPAKADVQATGVLALARIGEPAERAAIELLKGDDAELVEFCLRRIEDLAQARQPPGDEPYVATAALVLGTIGLPDATAPMIDALHRSRFQANRTIIARELTRLPATPVIERDFKKAYESISIETTVPPGSSALQMLTEAAPSFYDPELVDWLLSRATRTRGAGEDMMALEDAVLISALKLVKPDRLAKVKHALDSYGTQVEVDAYELARGLLEACGDSVPCYLDAVQNPDNQDLHTQFAGIKAAWMIGALGDEHSAEALVDRLDSISNAAVRYVAAQSIDHLLPHGSAAVADKLGAIIERDAKSDDVERIAGNAPLTQVAIRLRTRAR